MYFPGFRSTHYFPLVPWKVRYCFHPVHAALLLGWKILCLSIVPVEKSLIDTQKPLIHHDTVYHICDNRHMVVYMKDYFTKVYIKVILQVYNIPYKKKWNYLKSCERSKQKILRMDYKCSWYHDLRNISIFLFLR